MASEYYFVSDLHFGGDGALQHCDFAGEFTAFLRQLESERNDIELIVAGDTFGFWELTTVEGVAKFDAIVSHHQAIFDQFRETGRKIAITVMVGNHDYDLACHPAFEARLKEYNLNLDTAISLQRRVAGRTIWIEHGQQADSFNASPDYGNPYALPVGYFITRTIVAGASRHSDFGRGNWLKDIRSVGTENIPDWILSNYFYREMGWAIRAVTTMFLLLLTVTMLALVAELLRRAGVFDTNIILSNPLIRSLGYVGNVLYAIIAINMMILFFMLVVAIPGFVVYRDVRKTLRRFRVTWSDLEAIEATSNAPYLRRADEVFARHPDVAVYIFGHTHDAFLMQSKGRVVINTGTWLKILRRIPVRFGYLPAVYRPSFHLDCFHIFEEKSKMVIRHIEIAKTPVEELGLLQRLLTLGRGSARRRPIPERTMM
ncbi:MAG: metallophosphoesterase [Bradyrhizobiaceae bacterium]|nr:metallophosphoesterase [Bradyrhizobiaceae bacterium]